MSGRFKVILVETSRAFQQSIEQILKPCGISVLSYHDRWQAFRKIKRKREYHAVLIDKDLAGIGVLRTLFANMLRDLDKNMKFVVLIDSPETFDSRPFNDNGYENILPKAEIEEHLPRILCGLLGASPPRAASHRRRTAGRPRAAAGVC